MSQFSDFLPLIVVGKFYLTYKELRGEIVVDFHLWVLQPIKFFLPHKESPSLTEKTCGSKFFVIYWKCFHEEISYSEVVYV